VRVKTYWNPNWANKSKSMLLKELNRDGLVTLEELNATENATDFSRI